MGRDETIEIVDIFGGTQIQFCFFSSLNYVMTGMEAGPPLDFHKEMGGKRL